MDQILSVEETQIKDRKCILFRIKGGKQFILQCEVSIIDFLWNKSRQGWAHSTRVLTRSPGFSLPHAHLASVRFRSSQVLAEDRVQPCDSLVWRLPGGRWGLESELPDNCFLLPLRIQKDFSGGWGGRPSLVFSEL